MFNKHSLLSMKIEASYLYLIVFQLNCKLKQFLGDEKFLFAVHHAPSTPFILFFSYFPIFYFTNIVLSSFGNAQQQLLTKHQECKR